MQVALIASIVLAVCAAGCAVWCLVRVLGIPTPTLLLKVLSEVQVANEVNSGAISTLKSSFSRLQNDVDESLEQASSRLKRAASRDSNSRRREMRNVDEAPELLTEEASFALAEAANWADGSGSG